MIPRLPRTFFTLLMIVLPLLVVGGCGRRGTLEPQSGTGLALKARVAPRGASGAAVGTVDTIRVVVRDAAGVAVTPAVNIAIAAGQRTFQAVIDLTPATNLTVAILALGRRNVGERTVRGILWYDRIDGVSVVADQTTPLAALLAPFVPVAGPVEYPGGAGHRIRWGRVPGAAGYRVNWAGPGGDGSATTADTTFAAEGRRTYEIVSQEAGGGTSPPGDPLDAFGPPPPTTPAGLAARGVDENRIGLDWQAATGVGPITYDLARRTLPAPFDAPLLATGLTTLGYSDNPVDPNLTYAYRIRAVGPGGLSDWSAEVTGESLLPPPDVPGPLTVSASATTVLRLTWSTATGRVDAYDLERRIPPEAFAPLVTLPGAQTGYDDANLAENTTYEYRVAARNRGGRSDFTPAASGRTGLFPPNAPSGLSASADRPGEISLTWTDNSANEDGFELQRAPGGGGAFTTLVTFIPNTTSHRDDNLPDLTPYRYRIRAFRSTVASEYSAEATATTLGRVPNAPSDLVAEALSPRSVRLTWADNSANEVSFRIERQANLAWLPIGETSAGVTSFDVTGLTPATNYTFRVLAVNGTGDSGPSNEASVQTPPDAPNAPANLLATEVRHDRVHLTWLDNSANEQGFQILRQGGTGAPQTFQVGADINNFDDASVASRTGYSYQVRAFSGTAVSDYAGPVLVTTPIAPPGNLTAEAISSSLIALDWSAPPGSIGFYDIESRIPPADFGALATLTGTVTSYNAANLKSGTTYEFRVRARFNQEISEFSNVASATTVLTPPAAPTSLVGQATGPTVVSLSWTDNADNEASFEVEERIQGAITFNSVAAPGPNSTALLLTGRAASTTYEYRVRAVNSAGPSGYSNIAPVTTPNAPPATPLNFTGVGGFDRVDLFWTPGIGGGAPLDYRIERRLQGAGTFGEIGVASALQTDYGDLGLTTGSTFEYRMRARNNVGFSDYSDTVSVTTILAAPTDLTGLIDPNDTSVLIFWTDNTATESGFEIQRADAGTVLNWAPLVTVSENLNFYDDGAVTLGKTYVYRVRAVNAGGFSGWSNEFTILVEEFPLQIPYNLVPRPVGGNALNMTWVDTNFNETGYQLQLGIESDGTPSFAVLYDVTTAPNVTNVPFLQLSGRFIYSARVRALGANGAVSPWTPFVCAQLGATGPNAPSGLAATYLAGPNAVQLTWSDNSCNEERFEIYQTGTASILIGTVDPNTTVFYVTGITPGTKLYFVRAVNNEAGASSTTAGVVVPPPPARSRRIPVPGR